MGGSKKATRQGKQGQSMGGRLQLSPSAKRRYAKRLRAEEARWAAMAGPVTVTKGEEAGRIGLTRRPPAGIELGHSSREQA